MGRARHLFTQITQITATSGAKTNSINNIEANVLLKKTQKELCNSLDKWHRKYPQINYIYFIYLSYVYSCPSHGIWLWAVYNKEQ